MQPYFKYIFFGLLLIYLIINYINNKADKQTLAKYGVAVTAAIEQRSVAKGTATLTVKFRYQDKNFINECRNNDYSHRVGDSITVIIDSRDPKGPCVIQKRMDN